MVASPAFKSHVFERTLASLTQGLACRVHMADGDIIDPNMNPLSGGALFNAEGLHAFRIHGIQLDSRAIQPNDVFVAVTGTQVKGTDFIASAIEKGASVVMVDSQDLDLAKQKIAESHHANVAIIAVDALSQSLSRVAANFYGEPAAGLDMVGVTGTNGKSTLVSLVAQLMSLLSTPSATIGTLGYGLLGDGIAETGMTTPDAIACQKMLAEMKKQGAELVAMEVSSHGIHQGRVNAIDFDVALLTNITRDHLDYHGTFEAYAATKAEFVGLETNISVATHSLINVDDPVCYEIASKLQAQGKDCLTYSIKSPNADVYAHHVRFTHQGIQADIQTPWGGAQLQLGLIGSFNLSNALAAIASACLLGKEFSEVCRAAQRLLPVKGRMQKVRIHDAEQRLPAVYVDYAHTPDALEKALQALKEHADQPVTVVFGCGGDRDTGKRPQMAAIAEALADKVIATSDNPRTEDPQRILDDIAKGFTQPDRICLMVDRQQAIEHAIAHANAGECVLIAGKGHEDYQIIGTEKRHFDDYQEAEAALTRRLSLLENTQAGDA